MTKKDFTARITLGFLNGYVCDAWPKRAVECAKFAKEAADFVEQEYKDFFDNENDNNVHGSNE